MNEHPIDERLRATLSGAAGDLTVEPLAPDALARRGRSRRRRRRALAVCAVGAVTTGAIVIATRGDDGAVQTADEPESTTTAPALVLVDPPDTDTDTDGAEQTGDESEVATTPTPTSVPTGEAADDLTTPIVANGAVDTAALSPIGPDQLVPWRDGFVSVRLESHPQPLPELSDEIRALFPDEVLELFGGNPPATIGEATTLLSEAGLLDEVTAVLDEHPEAADAIYAVDAPPPTLRLEFTSDGQSWESIDADLPIDDFPNLSTAGDTLVVWSLEQPEYDERGRALDDGARTLTVARTTDLESWSVTTIDLPVPTDTPPFVHAELWVQSFAATPDGFVASASSSTWIDEYAILPDEVLEQLDSGAGGFGMSVEAEGIRVDIWDEGSSAPRTELYTWDDLGVEPIDVDRFFGPTEQPVLVVGSGESTEIVPPPAGLDPVQQLASTELGVVAVGNGVVMTSSDGVAWEPLGGLPDDASIHSAVPVTSGTLLIASDGEGSRAWLLDATREMTEVVLPELPQPYSLWSGSGSSSAWILETYDEALTAWEPFTVVIEHDGVRVSITDGRDGRTIVAATPEGEIVYDRTQSYDEPNDYYEFDDATGEGALVLRDADGAELVSIPLEIVDAAFAEQLPTSVTDPMTDDYQPDLWLVATSDGTHWLTVDLPDPDMSNDYYGPTSAAVNGDRVLYSSVDGWQLATIG